VALFPHDGQAECNNTNCQRVHSLAQKQNDAALVIGAYRALATTIHFLGDSSPLDNTRRGVFRSGRSGSAQSSAEDFYLPVVGCLVYVAVSEWHLGDIASCRAAIAEAISLAKEISDTNALALALNFAAQIGHYERNPAEVDGFASGLIELSARHNFVHWLAIGAIHRGWARIASGDTAEGISFLEPGIFGQPVRCRACHITWPKKRKHYI
jgi:hypothetical protein